MNQLTDIKKLDALIKNKNYDEALILCNILLEEKNSAEHRDLLRKRSHIHSLLGDYQQAIGDRLELIDEAQEEADIFFASLYLIRAGKFKDAYRTVNMGIAELPETHTPYTDELVFLRAYTLVKLELYQEAIEACSHIKDGMKMWISNFNTPTSKDELIKAAESKSSAI
ncbi:hypothetical protein A9179_02405 [Pseudomonas alcaligenes]|uniref:Tetratricopeptide repeat protein n=1 Tax=Aquipseudomonas alcaligenes TaxID=43263 RepID=A0ABR7RXS1_AQUAC|nr:hypothetical protein [Pseudomonas alcaligenes]MBC9249121.1 hypothetical protein [Pseudomonas alcaligenes]